VEEVSFFLIPFFGVPRNLPLEGRGLPLTLGGGSRPDPPPRLENKQWGGGGTTAKSTQPELKILVRSVPTAMKGRHGVFFCTGGGRG